MLQNMDDSRLLVAVIMTCHEQRDQVTASLLSVFEQQDATVRPRAYVTDAGSTDGTLAALQGIDSDVTTIPRGPSVFWAEGMRESEARALADMPDYLLWLNADTILDRGALRRMLDVSMEHPAGIVVGATRGTAVGGVSYGGRRRVGRWHPQRFVLMNASDRVQLADSFNGNVVLLPRSVAELVGPIDGEFPHAYADDDYGLRASALGVSILQAPGTVGLCPANPSGGMVVRGPRAWIALQDPKGLPIRAQIRYWRRHGGLAWPVLLLAQQAKVLVGLRPVQLTSNGPR